MSLVSADNLYNLHKRLQQIFASEDPFGGRSLLLVGDILQLPPIRASQIFASPRQFDSHVMFKSKELNLWENCQSVLLETNFRQGEGPWLEMLNRFRIGEATDEDIKILESRQSSLLSDTEYNNATHLFLSAMLDIKDLCVLLLISTICFKPLKLFKISCTFCLLFFLSSLLTNRFVHFLAVVTHIQFLSVTIQYGREKANSIQGILLWGTLNFVR